MKRRDTPSARFGLLPTVARDHCHAMWRGDIDQRHRSNRALLGQAVKFVYGLTETIPEPDWYRHAVNDGGW